MRQDSTGKQLNKFLNKTFTNKGLNKYPFTQQLSSF